MRCILAFLAAALAASLVPLPLAAQEAPAEAPASPQAAPEALPAEAAAPSLVSPIITIGAEAGYTKTGAYYDGKTGRAYVAIEEAMEHLRLFGELSMYADDKYAPAKANLPGGELLGLYFIMEEGGIESSFGPVSLRAGRFKHYDVIDSPYSLFVNSRGNAALLANIRYEDDFFFYESRWLCLNQDAYMDAWGDATHTFSDTAWPEGYPDRGANIKTYGFKLRNGMRFGFQDAAIYTGRSFDLEYLLNPIPQYFIQYAKTNGGRPWATGSNENDMIGAFWDWKRDDGYDFNAQVLMDDFNVGGFGDTPRNPWKLAWALGGRKKLAVGSVGFYHAGATKYSFSPITMGEDDDGDNLLDEGQVAQNAISAYGYTYYPDTRFDRSYDFDFSDSCEIAIEDNAIGYKHGENNLAFQADYTFEYRDSYMVSAALEFVLAGANSPANPWQDDNKHPIGTKLLNDEVLEKRIVLKLASTWREGDWSYSVRIDGGIRIDAMELVEPDATDNVWTRNLWIWKPQDGNNVPVARIMLGAKYAWKLR
ncbi:MAG TPA: hypothetical protein PLB91_02250 [Spirochaetales bacterium]|nr:hypothetical protein [Spirochaetales bacterium]HRY53107.1 hypothetical protein [Spirochaetia bacterium]HRZ64676.1 hypothetical protein [Spirochaetia bacterium]